MRALLFLDTGFLDTGFPDAEFVLARFGNPALLQAAAGGQ